MCESCDAPRFPGRLLIEELRLIVAIGRSEKEGIGEFFLLPGSERAMMGNPIAVWLGLGEFRSHAELEVGIWLLDERGWVRTERVTSPDPESDWWTTRLHLALTDLGRERAALELGGRRSSPCGK